MGQILLLDECTDAEKVGSLAAHLAILSRGNLRIVSGFVLPFGFNMQDGSSNEIMRHFDKLHCECAVLRPSYLYSDSKMDEVLRDVHRRDLLDAIRYLKNKAIRHGWKPAIVIQRDLQAEVSGTIHSINPATKNRGEILIEANLWMNKTVLGGLSEPDMILLDKNTGATFLESEEEDEICLTPEQIHELFVVVRKSEKRLGYPVSLDWAYDNGVLYILRDRRLDEKRLKEYEYED